VVEKEKKTKRRLTLLLAVLALVPLAFTLRWWTQMAGVAVNRSKFDLIQVGMKLSDVEKLLGGPPGDYRTAEVELDLSVGTPQFDNVMFAPEVLTQKQRFRHEWWQGDEGTAWVCFDEQSNVVKKEFTPGERVSPSVIDKIRSLIGLRPKK
jgi:hypothetical protein